MSLTGKTAQFGSDEQDLHVEGPGNRVNIHIREADLSWGCEYGGESTLQFTEHFIHTHLVQLGHPPIRGVPGCWSPLLG